MNDRLGVVSPAPLAHAIHGAFRRGRERLLFRRAALLLWLVACFASFMGPGREARAQDFTLIREWTAQDPQDIWVSPSNRVYVQRPGEVLEMDATTGQILTRFAVVAQALVALRNGDVLIGKSLDSKIYRYRTGNTASVGTFATGAGFNMVSMLEAPNGVVYVLNRNGDIARFNADGSNRQVVVRNSDHPSVSFLWMKLDAATQTLVVGSGSRMIRVSLSGLHLADLDQGFSGEFSVAPDGTILNFGSLKGQRIFPAGQNSGQPFQTSAFDSLDDIEFDQAGLLHVADFFANQVRVYGGRFFDPIAPARVFKSRFESSGGIASTAAPENVE